MYYFRLIFAKSVYCPYTPSENILVYEGEIIACVNTEEDIAKLTAKYSLEYKDLTVISMPCNDEDIALFDSSTDKQEIDF